MIFRLNTFCYKCLVMFQGLARTLGHYYSFTSVFYCNLMVNRSSLTFHPFPEKGYTKNKLTNQ